MFLSKGPAGKCGWTPCEGAGEVEFRDRREGQPEFHHTRMPTSEHLARFGHWQYATDHGEELTRMIHEVAGTGRDQVPRVVSAELVRLVREPSLRGAPEDQRRVAGLRQGREGARVSRPAPTVARIFVAILQRAGPEGRLSSPGGGA